MTRNWLLIVLLFTVTSIGSGYTSAEIIDPTRPPNVSGAHDDKFVLTAILIAPDHRMAVINGKIVHVGEQINGAKVVDIRASNVDIEGPNGKVSLVLTDFSAGGSVKNAK
jgi:hypothetical protein